MTTPKLRILLVAASPQDARFAQRVLEDHGDEVRISDEAKDALAHLARQHFDVAMISLSLPRGDGLALVHHVRALHPNVDVIVMSPPTAIEETAHAIALGVLQSVLLPLSGDAVLVAADRARERRILVAERARLAAQEAMSRRRTATYARCAAFVAETDVREVAQLVLDACAGELECVAAGAYIASHGGDGFVLSATSGKADDLPRRLEDRDLAAIDPTVPVTEEDGRVRLVLLGDADLVGVIELVPRTFPIAAEPREGLEIIAGLGTAALVAARKVDAIARTGIKDPDTSAYTFAYFGEVAGREIDRAARYKRRFALLTLSFDALEERRERLSPKDLVAFRRAITDAILEAVKDSDVVARVEDDEYYVLLPETGLLGALSTRRRIRQRCAALALADGIARDSYEPMVGIATYPADGLDLGRLLRLSRRRAERSRRGVFRRLGFADRPFWECIDQLLDHASQVGAGADMMPDSIRRAQDEVSLSRHAQMNPALLLRLASQLAGDAVRFRAPGTIYVSGDSQVAQAVAQAVDVKDAGSIRAWAVGSDPTGPAGRIALPVDDRRIGDQILFLSLTELGGYVLAARPLAQGGFVAFHSSDLDLVDGLVTQFQAAYHLQPEVGE